MGKLPDALHEPFQSLLPRLTRAAAASPTAVYLFSSDEMAEARDLFAYALSAAMVQHVPSTLLVDCGFLDVGLHGVVPQRDALGFLDLLLYGSSLGVITQETSGGVRVVGAGSFPVTKKMPFVMNAFQEASRRLVSHAHCAIFCGPLHDDDGELHPLIAAADVPILVRTVEPDASVVDPVEEQLSSHFDAELLSIRINPRGAVRTAAAPLTRDVPRTEPEEAPVEPPPLEREPEFKEIEGDLATTQEMKAPPPLPSEPPSRAQPPATPPADESTPPPTVEYDEEIIERADGRRTHASLIPKIATAAVGLIVIVFLVWWFNEERRIGDKAEPDQIAASDAPQTQTDPTTAVEPEAATSVDTSAAGSVTGPEMAQDSETPVPSQPSAQTESDDSDRSTPPPATGAGAEPAGLINSEDILVMDDLESNWGGYHLIHVSSFRGSAKARSDVESLKARGFPVFVVYIDLGAKGKWYRVYAGPMESREEARNMKKNLDDTPGVRFTRITQIPN